MTLVTDIQLCFSKNQYLGAIFLDLTGAYDCVNLTILEKKLVAYSISPHIARTIVDMYKNRSIFVRINNKKIGPRLTSNGIAQGSALSALLFNIYTADLHFEYPFSNIIQYADDFCIYVDHKKLEECKRIMSYIMKKVCSWCDENGLELSKDKSVVTFFTRHNIPAVDHIYLGQLKLPYQNVVKYLGIFLDRKLTWKPHIEAIVARCTAGINFLRTVAKTWWGADPQVCLLFYKSFLRSIIDYGSLLYASASKHLLRKLDIIQNKALRISLGAMSSTPRTARTAPFRGN